MIEHDTRAVHSANDVELAEKKTRVERFGKLDPALFNHLQGLSNSDVVSATIILEIQPGAALSDLELEVTNELSQKYPEVRNAVANNRSPMDVPDVALSHKIRAEYLSGITNRVQQRVNAFLQILEARRIQYTPFAGMPAVIVTATKAQLIQLAQHPSVGNVFLANYDKVVLAAPSSMPTRSVSNGHHTASNIEAVWALGYKGSGTSVAVLDSSVADTSSVSSHCPDLNGANNCFLNLGDVYPFFSLITDHATAIAGVVASNAVYPDAPNETLGIAPLTTIHRGGTISGTSEQVVQALDWALFTSLVDVASASVVTYSSTGTPSSFAWAFDYQARLAQRTVVAAAGNNGDYVASPGAGWNSLVVGGYHHETSTMWENDLKGEASSWKNPSTGAEKPDVVAPAFANFLEVGGSFANSDGTSLSAPHVAAIAALLIERNSDLRNTPTALKSILMATARNIEGPTGLLWSEDHRDGAGAVDALGALQVAGNRGQHGTTCLDSCWISEVLTPGDFTNWTRSYEVYAEAGDRIRFGTSWWSQADDPSSSPVLSTDLDMYLLDPDNSVVPGSFSFNANNNVEMIPQDGYIIAPKTGIYTLVVQKYEFNETSNLVGIAYSREEALANSGTITGTTWYDADMNGIRGDPMDEYPTDGLNLTLYKDANNNGIFEPNFGDTLFAEVEANYDDNNEAVYSFIGIPPGNYWVLGDYTYVTSTNPIGPINIGPSDTINDIDFGVWSSCIDCS